MRRSLALISLALVATACTKAKEPEKKPLGETAATAAAASGAPADANAISGSVLEQLPASPYVYLKLKTEKGDVWAAVPETKITVGEKVTIYNALAMGKFESKTLNRTFDEVYFGNLTPPEAPTATAGNAPPKSVGTPPAVDAKVGKVEKASGADARTIAELWEQKRALSGKTVTIRGVVVKYNANVMGKNWVHLQDGSGEAAKGTHDITVTTMDAVTLSSTVTITGRVALDRNFGAGYSYPLIVEEAKVVKK
jgi:hypothetical protein